MPFEISKEFRFEAAHRLLGHPKCGRLHGHSYRVIFTLQSNGLREGMVQDYADLSPIKDWIDQNLDHRYLVSAELMANEDLYSLASLREDRMQDLAVMGALPRSTAECLAQYLYERFVSEFDFLLLTSVTVCETASTSATYRPGT